MFGPYCCNCCNHQLMLAVAGTKKKCEQVTWRKWRQAGCVHRKQKQKKHCAPSKYDRLNWISQIRGKTSSWKTLQHCIPKGRRSCIYVPGLGGIAGVHQGGSWPLHLAADEWLWDVRAKKKIVPTVTKPQTKTQRIWQGGGGFMPQIHRLNLNYSFCHPPRRCRAQEGVVFFGRGLRVGCNCWHFPTPGTISYGTDWACSLFFVSNPK